MREIGEAMDLNDVPDSIKERAKECKTPEELLALAAEMGHDLTEEELKSFTGGASQQGCFFYMCGDVNCNLCTTILDHLVHR